MGDNENNYSGNLVVEDHETANSGEMKKYYNGHLVVGHCSHFTAEF